MFNFQGKSCVCIKSSETFRSSPVISSNCNFKCFNRTNDIYKNECGGNSSYNLFEFDSSIFFLQMKCYYSCYFETNMEIFLNFVASQFQKLRLTTTMNVCLCNAAPKIKNFFQRVVHQILIIFANLKVYWTNLWSFTYF